VISYEQGTLKVDSDTVRSECRKSFGPSARSAQTLWIPQEALRGGIPGAVLEPLGRSCSHFVGIYCQRLTKSFKNDF